MEMPNTSFIAQQKTQCALWMAEDHGKNAIQRKVLYEISLTGSIQTHNQFLVPKLLLPWKKFSQGGNRRPTIGEEEQKEIGDALHASPRRSIRETGAVGGVHHTTAGHFLRNKLKMFAYRVQTGPKPSQTDMESRAALTQLCRENLEKNL